MRAISISQRIESSYAFLISPFLLFEYVTCRFVLFSILFICNLTRPIFLKYCDIFSLFFNQPRLSKLLYPKPEIKFYKIIIIIWERDFKEGKTTEAREEHTAEIHMDLIDLGHSVFLICIYIAKAKYCMSVWNFWGCFNGDGIGVWRRGNEGVL